MFRKLQFIALIFVGIGFVRCSKSSSGGCTASSLYEISCPTTDAESQNDDSGSDSGSGGSSSDSSTSGGSGSSSSTSGSTSGSSGTGSAAITSLSPIHGSNAGGDVVTIVGTDFESGDTVDIGSSSCAVTSLSSTEIVCTTSAHASGAATVTITEARSKRFHSRASSFYYHESSAYDTSFNIDGTASTGALGTVLGMSLYLTSANKIFVAGPESTGGDMARFTTNGELDTTFSSSGTSSLASTSGPVGYEVYIDSSNKILITGTGTSLAKQAIVRYTTNGQIDTTFIHDGGISSETFFATNVDSSGRVLVGGHLTNDAVLFRMHSNGVLDTAFDLDGKITIDLGGNTTEDIIYSVNFDGNNKIIAGGVGRSSKFMTAVRVLTDGRLDTTFDLDGIATTNISGGYGLAIQNDGRILVSGGTGQLLIIGRFNSNGTLDTSFEIDGKTSAQYASNSNIGYALALQTNQKIISVGNSSGSDHNLIVVRFATNGELDTSFSTDGIHTIQYASDSYGFGVQVQNDGIIVLGGGPSGRFAISRIFP